MTDEEYLSWVEKRIREAFSPRFGGAAFFNRELFDYVLDQAGEDIAVLDRHMANFNREHLGDGLRAKLRVDNARAAIKLKIYTPTAARKVTITRGAVDVRPMSPDE
jgi:hypothetical protein